MSESQLKWLEGNENQHEVHPHHQPGLGKAAPPTAEEEERMHRQPCPERVVGNEKLKPSLVALLRNQGSRPVAGMKTS